MSHTMSEMPWTPDEWDYIPLLICYENQVNKIYLYIIYNYWIFLPSVHSCKGIIKVLLSYIPKVPLI